MNNDLTTRSDIYRQKVLAALYLAVRYSTETHDFRVDGNQKTLTISAEWLTPGSEILKANWNRSGDTLDVTGTWGKKLPIHLTLERKPMRIKDHQ